MMDCYCHTFFSLAPNLRPGVSFSTKKQVTPLAPDGSSRTRSAPQVEVMSINKMITHSTKWWPMAVHLIICKIKPINFSLLPYD